MYPAPRFGLPFLVSVTAPAASIRLARPRRPRRRDEKALDFRRPRAGRLQRWPAAERPPTIYESTAALSPQNPIDEIVFTRLKDLNIQPARLCSDAVFVRRVYLDVIGTLPTGVEARQFILDRDPNKRRALDRPPAGTGGVCRLLGHEVERLLRVKAEFPINLWPNAAQAYHRWIRTSIKENCLTTSSSAKCSPPAAAISACRRSISTAPCKAGIRRPSPRPSP